MQDLGLEQTTRVLTSKGIKELRHIRVGDRVETCSGFARVNKVRSYLGNAVVLETNSTVREITIGNAQPIVISSRTESFRFLPGQLIQPVSSFLPWAETVRYSLLSRTGSFLIHMALIPALLRFFLGNGYYELSFWMRHDKVLQVQRRAHLRGVNLIALEVGDSRHFLAGGFIIKA